MKYETDNLMIASALFSQGHTCNLEKVGLLKNGKSKILFIFITETPEEEEQLTIRVEKVNRGELNVNLKGFMDSYTTLKNLTFE